MMVRYTELEGRSVGFYLWLALLAAVMALGGAAAWHMEHQGHVVTGMTNQVVWGMPHVFAILLIVAASGALNVASMASVFDRELYKPLSRLSALSAVALLAGGLCVLVLDLGRPERLVVAMTRYNFKSVFAWNVFLYTGFMAVVLVYLWMMMERRMNRFVRPAGMVAFAWRLILTSGTGSIFGFLVAREAYDSALMAPLFIAISLSAGTAAFLLVLAATWSWTGRRLDDATWRALGNLQGMLVIAVLYFVLIYHVTNLYVARHDELERFILLDGGRYTFLFWGGQIVVGSVLPLWLLYGRGRAQPVSRCVRAAVLVLAGTMAQLYVIIIGGQAFPQATFPGFEVLESSFFDGVVARYDPSLPEVLLGLGGIGVALAILTVGLKVLPFLPQDPAPAGGNGG